jgi:predicted esterase
MEDNLEDENQDNEGLIINEKIEINEIPSNKRKKIIVFIIFIIVVLILIIILIIIFATKDDNNELIPLVFNSTSGNHTHTIIFLPGLGNTPEDFRNILLNKINFTKKNDTTIIILRSPLIEITANKTKKFNAWFDVFNIPLADYSDINLSDVNKSAKILENYVDNEVNLLNGDYSKIIVGGHSQGACISLYQAYTTNKNYGGVFAFSGILPPCSVNEDKRKMKTYYGYGDKDNVILPSFINKSLERIIDFEGFDLHIYKNHYHYVHINQTIDAGKFLDNLIK